MHHEQILIGLRTFFIFIFLRKILNSLFFFRRYQNGEGGLAPVNWGLEIGLGAQVPITQFDGFVHHCFWKLKLHRQLFFSES